MSKNENSEYDTSTPYVGKRVARDGLNSIVSTIAILILAPLLAIFITSFIFQAYQVDGPSMLPTLNDKDRLIVVKFSRTISRITRKAYIPNRADIVIFNKHGSLDASNKQEKQLVKRVIALPGERVVVNDGKTTVYNNDFPGGFNPDDNEAYSQNIDYTPGKVDLTVPDDEIFVMGDNRSNSSDSRFFGTIPARDVIGEVVVRILPINSAQTF